MSEKAKAEYVLPAALTGRADLARLLREIETVDGELESQKARAHGHDAAYRLPNMSQALGDFLEQNDLDIADDQARLELVEHLRTLKEKAPVLHLTFSTSADPESLEQLVTYVRREIHPYALLSIGLQPALVGGACVRSPNHVYDLSLRERLNSQRGLIAHDLEELLRG